MVRTGPSSPTSRRADHAGGRPRGRGAGHGDPPAARGHRPRPSFRRARRPHGRGRGARWHGRRWYLLARQEPGGPADIVPVDPRDSRPTSTPSSTRRPTPTAAVRPESADAADGSVARSRPGRGVHRVRRGATHPPAAGRLRHLRRLAPRRRPRPDGTGQGVRRVAEPAPEGQRGGVRAADHRALERRRVPATLAARAVRSRRARPASRSPDVEERSALFDALQALPEMQRKVVLLRHWLGLSTAETAAELGIGEGTVKSHCSRGRERLQRLLTDADLTPEAPRSGAPLSRARGRGGPGPRRLRGRRAARPRCAWRSRLRPRR